MIQESRYQYIKIPNLSSQLTKMFFINFFSLGSRKPTILDLCLILEWSVLKVIFRYWFELCPCKKAILWLKYWGKRMKDGYRSLVKFWQFFNPISVHRQKFKIWLSTFLVLIWGDCVQNFSPLAWKLREKFKDDRQTYCKIAKFQTAPYITKIL